MDRFNTIYRENVALVFNYLRRFLSDAEDAEDATVETFRRLHVALPKFRGDCVERTFVMRIATTVAIRVKDQRVKSGLPSLDAMAADGDDGRPWEPASTENIELRAVNADLVREVLSKLEPKQRAAVWLRVGLEYSDSEVAEILRVPVGTVKAWVWRSLSKLRREHAALEACEEVSAT